MIFDEIYTAQAMQIDDDLETPDEDPDTDEEEEEKEEDDEDEKDSDDIIDDWAEEPQE